MKKRVLVFTAGEVEERPNPSMKPHAWEPLRKLRHLLPSSINTVHIGTGHQHWDVACALGFDESKWLRGAKLRFAESWGTGAKYFEGQRVPLVILPWGKVIDEREYAGGEEQLRQALRTLRSLDVVNDDVICTDGTTFTRFMSRGAPWLKEPFETIAGAAYELTITATKEHPELAELAARAIVA
jgi:hypothetical protein